MTEPEFSRPVAIDRLTQKPRRYEIEATPEECAALAERYKILGVTALKAEIDLKITAAGIVSLAGRLTGEVVQACVVSLVPVTARIEESFTRTYAPADEAFDAETDPYFDPTASEPPDPIQGGTVDIGEAAAEELALALDPFPRAPGAVFAPAPDEAESPDESQAKSPFAALSALKKQ